MKEDGASAGRREEKGREKGKKEDEGKKRAGGWERGKETHTVGWDRLRLRGGGREGQQRHGNKVGGERKNA